MDHFEIELLMLFTTIASVIIALIALRHADMRFHKQIEPIISINLSIFSNILIATIVNNGSSPATHLKVCIKSIYEGDEDIYDKDLDSLSAKYFDLYPLEEVSEIIWSYGGTPGISPDLIVSMSLSYYDRGKKIEYERTLIVDKKASVRDI